MSAAVGPASGRPLVLAFGATGDLMQRKLLPALYSVARALPEPAPGLFVLGAARHPLDDAMFQQTAARALVAARAATAPAARRWCRAAVRYATLGGEDAADFDRLADRVRAVERAEGLAGNRIVYLALPAEAIPAVVERLGASGLHRGPGWTRVVIEKPFGHDLESARALNDLLHRFFHESEIYRIDHYLGKETVQNLIVFRFANMLFEPVWNRDRVDQVEITVAEDLGVEERAGYYDQSGALRDMVQSHLTQLLTLTAMEVPSSLTPDEVRNEKVKVLRSLAPIRPSDVVRGQYVAGTVHGARVPAYRAESGVARTSTTETYAAVRLRINNWRWQGTEFILRTGKRLPTKSTQIVVRFRTPPVWFFPRNATPPLAANTLTITLQPDEGFELSFEVKRPGHEIRLATERLHFRYAEAFGPLADAYQTLLLDVVRGDPTLFVRADEVEEAWRVYDPALRRPSRLHPYPAGSAGPAAGVRLGRPPGRPGPAP
ncbi:MAG TPA: glucose-6-phosphate dehydrogenase [Thermoplasmata archaeon]|nr:glucose-6-phosphate dehydrogenase [Thermoplasmata archaeon]